MAKTKIEKPQKKSFADGMADRYRETRDLGQTLIHEPRSFPGKILIKLRRSTRKIWNARGGGLYACGFVIAFALFEAQMFIDDIVNFDGFDSIGEEIVTYLFRFFLESLGNTVRAFAWPAYVIEWSPMWGALFLALTFWLFPKYVKHHVEGWLFQDADEDVEATATKDVGVQDESNAADDVIERSDADAQKEADDSAGSRPPDIPGSD